MQQKIDPDKLYSFAEAARLLPSCQAGKTLTVRTLHNWRRRGQLAAQARPSGRLLYWFVWGAELVRLIGGQPRVVRTPPELEREHKQNLKALRKMGVKV